MKTKSTYSPVGQFFRYIVFGLMVLLGGHFFYSTHYHEIVEIISSASWTPTPCEVVTSTLREIPSSIVINGTRKMTYQLEVNYKFYINTQQYTGTRYSLLETDTSDYTEMKALLDTLQPGKHLTCFVEQSNPSLSVIDRTLHESILYKFIPLLFCLFGLGGLCKTIQRTTQSIQLPENNDNEETRKYFPLFKEKLWAYTPLIKDSVSLLICYSLQNSLSKDNVLSILGVKADKIITFVMIAIVIHMCYVVIRIFIKSFNPNVNLKISNQKLYPGSQFTLSYQFDRSPQRLTAFSFFLMEKEKWIDRANKSKERILHESLLYENKAREIPFSEEVTLTLPEGITPHSIDIGNKKWYIKAKGKIPFGVDIDDDFPIFIGLPEVAQKEGTELSELNAPDLATLLSKQFVNIQSSYNRVMKFFQYIVFGLMVLIGGCSFYPERYKQMVEIMDSAYWVPTPCEIVSIAMRGSSTVNRGRGTIYQIDVAYKFKFNDKEYSGNRYSILGDDTSDYAIAKGIINSLQPGSKITCYVKKENPQQSVIERNMNWPKGFQFISLFFLLIGLFGLYITAKRDKA